MANENKTFSVDLSTLGLSKKEQKKLGKKISKATAESLARIDHGGDVALIGKLRDPGLWGYIRADTLEEVMEQMNLLKN